MLEIGSTAEISPQQVEELRTLMEAAHSTYSKCFYDRTEREQELRGVAGRRSSLVARLSEVKGELRAAVRAAIKTAGDGATFNPAVSRVSEFRDRMALLTQTIDHYNVFDLSDAQRAVMLALITEKENQISF